MALTAGTRLGPYEITAQIGVGGMGEVWSATDTNLGRQVAIKILPDAFAEDPDRLARFEREAKTLASLNHPNIAIIHGLEKADGIRALVMELVEGPTLADRIAHARIPIDEALPIAKQIAEALEAAHEQGVIHRDLKPSNIKLRADGMVKVLDFGLAKALERVSAPSASTVTSPAMTGIGTILGTAAYMSPEQALGKSVDRRADIWAFGCVLYEMLTGRMAFRGEAVTDTLAAVIRADPDWSVLPTSTPHAVRALVRRCLHKDPRQRLQAIGEARIQCEEVRSDAAESESHPSRMRPWTSWVVAALVGAVIAATTAGLIVWNVKPSSSSPRTVRRFSIVLPPGQRLAGLTRPAVSFSPDGSLLAYVATTQGEGARQIYLRSMESGETRPIRGTEGTINPFFSPDGQWLGFYTFEGNAIMKIPVKGGVAQRVTGDVITWGTTWGAEHAIVFAPYLSVLQQATENGGKPEPLTHFEKGETEHEWPDLLPGGKAVLFNAVTDSPMPAIAVQRIEGERRDLQGQAGFVPRYVSSGHVIYGQLGNLMAVPFDLEQLAVPDGATPTPVVSGVLQATTAVHYSVSRTGSLAYVPGKVQGGESTLVWVSRTGKEEALGAPAHVYNQPRLSPNGQRVAVDIVDRPGMQVWLYDLGGQLTPFTYRDEGTNRHAVWTSDSKRIVFMSNRQDAAQTQIYSQSADRGGLQQLTSFPPTTTADILPIPYSTCGDGLLTFVRLAPTTEVWALQMGEVSGGSGEQRKPQRLSLQIPVADGAPQLSPDCRWLAYASNESGRREIYVRAFPSLDNKRQISMDGGNEPQWNPDSRKRELFYRSGQDMMAVNVSAQGAAEGRAQRLFTGPYLNVQSGYARANYDVSPDGERFLMLKPVEQEPATQINVVLDWTEELKRLVPTK